MFSNEGFEFVISNIITFLILCSETILHSSYIDTPGKQVAVNSHQLYPQNQPQLPKKWYTIFPGMFFFVMWASRSAADISEN